MPNQPEFPEVEFTGDDCHADCQNSNAVAGVAAGHIASQGIGTVHVISPQNFSLPLPGWEYAANIGVPVADNSHYGDESDGISATRGSYVDTDEYYANTDQSNTYNVGADQEWVPRGGVTVTTRDYADGSKDITVTDRLGNGTYTTETKSVSTVTYTQSDWGAEMPIILDLDGDGIEVGFGDPVYFDIDGDGFKEQTSWVGSDDGFLVIDLNADGSVGAGDGVIDQTKELVFAQWGTPGMTDLQALASAQNPDGSRIFDSDWNGIFNANDTLWSSFRVCRDVNQNGISDPGELSTLDALGISQINLIYDNGASYQDQSDDITVLGLFKIPKCSRFLEPSRKNGSVILPYLMSFENFERD